jgi:putative Mn2+ efflux pump MntP
MSYQPAVPLDDSLRLRAAAAVSWGAILAGAVAAISLSVLLLTLGSGLGFAAISPWANHGASAADVVISGAIWLIVTQWISAAIGGYLTGRLRHRWLATHAHEVFFRDTAHGLVTWSVATIVVVLTVSASLSSLGGGLARAGSAAAKGGMELAHAPMAVPGAGGDEHAYGTDKAAMSSGATSRPDAGDYRLEAVHIAARAASTGDISDEDRNYLAAVVAAKAGVSMDEAQRRVDAFVAEVKDGATRAKSAADEARKAAAQAAIYTALAMLIGAFIASVSAALGGHLRDEHL